MHISSLESGLAETEMVRTGEAIKQEMKLVIEISRIDASKERSVLSFLLFGNEGDRA